MESANQEKEVASLSWRSENFRIILASTMMGIMGVSLVSPLLPQLKQVFGVSDAAVGLVIPAFTLPGIVLSPFVGLAADRFGRRVTLVPLLVLFGIAGTAIAFASNFTQVLAFRVLQGIGGSALIMLAITLIGDYYDDPRRSAAIGLNGGAIGGSAAVFPLIGGVLASVRWYVPFLFYSVAVAVGLYALFVLDEPRVEQQHSTYAYFKKMLAALSFPRAIAFHLVVFAVYFVFYGGMLTAVPLLLGGMYGLPSAQIGLLLSTMSIASATVNSQYGRVSDWSSPDTLIPIGFIWCGTALLGLSLLPPIALVAVALFGFGIGLGLIQPSIDSVIVGLVPGRLRAGMMSVRTSTLRLGQTAGPVAFTALASGTFGVVSTGYPTVLSGVGGLVIVAGVVVLIARLG
jgi:ACDE family multidrug resistance protein